MEAMIKDHPYNAYSVWRLGGVIHKTDGPAVIRVDGTKEWYQNGKRHRVGGPAIIHPNGKEEWYQYGELHREGGPAVTYPYGREEWYINGKRCQAGGEKDEDRKEDTDKSEEGEDIQVGIIKSMTGGETFSAHLLRGDEEVGAPNS